MLTLIHMGTPEFAPRNHEAIRLTQHAFLNTPQGEADLVVIGTSHIYRAFDPLSFEALTGRPAFNFSFNGMTAAEMSKTVQMVAKNVQNKNIKHVILEGRGFSSVQSNNLKTDRVILSSHLTSLNHHKRLNISSKTLSAFKPYGLNILGLGKLHRYDFERQAPHYQSRLIKTEARRRELKTDGIIVSGSSPLKVKIRELKSNLRHVEDKGFGSQDKVIKPDVQQTMAQKYVKIAKSKINKTPLSQREITHYKIMIEQLEKAGAKVHLVLPPTISPQWMRTHDKFLHAKRRGLKSTPLYDLRIRQHTSDFADMTLWADHGHLNDRGAQIFTQLLAQPFKSKPKPKPRKPKPRKSERTVSLANLNTISVSKPDCEAN